MLSSLLLLPSAFAACRPAPRRSEHRGQAGDTRFGTTTPRVASVASGSAGSRPPLIFPAHIPTAHTPAAREHDTRTTGRTRIPFVFFVLFVVKNRERTHHEKRAGPRMTTGGHRGPAPAAPGRSGSSAGRAARTTTAHPPPGLLRRRVNVNLSPGSPPARDFLTPGCENLSVLLGEPPGAPAACGQEGGVPLRRAVGGQLAGPPEGRRGRSGARRPRRAGPQTGDCGGQISESSHHGALRHPETTKRRLTLAAHLG